MPRANLRGPTPWVGSAPAAAEHVRDRGGARAAVTALGRAVTLSPWRASSSAACSPGIRDRAGRPGRCCSGSSACGDSVTTSGRWSPYASFEPTWSRTSDASPPRSGSRIGRRWSVPGDSSSGRLPGTPSSSSTSPACFATTSSSTRSRHASTWISIPPSRSSGTPRGSRCASKGTRISRRSGSRSARRIAPYPRSAATGSRLLRRSCSSVGRSPTGFATTPSPPWETGAATGRSRRTACATGSAHTRCAG